MKYLYDPVKARDLEYFSYRFGQGAHHEFRFGVLLAFGDKQDRAQSHAVDVGKPLEVQNYRDLLPPDFLEYPLVKFPSAQTFDLAGYVYYQSFFELIDLDFKSCVAHFKRFSILFCSDAAVLS